mmetsp:Transcript_135272/g.263460  ORF Transcript_135272/g.263460 Transcript_135272/m.263460 type:complete len:560 (-) Transcript_135272:46-1725(-)
MTLLHENAETSQNLVIGMPPPPESAESSQKPAIGSVSAMKEATVSVQPADVAGIELLSASQMARRLWFVFTLSGLCNVFNMLEVNIYLPYLYSRVQCCEHDGVLLDSKYDIVKQDSVADMQKAAISLGKTMNLTRDGAGLFYLPACSLPHFPAGHELWSMSSKCQNKAFVQDTAQQILSMSQPIQKGLGILVLPVASAMADVKGRVPVMAAFISCLMLACMCFAADACGFMSGNALVYMGGAMLFPSWDPKDAIVNGVVADVLGNDENNKSRAFSSSLTINNIGSVVCSAISYVCIRLHLTSYFLPWFAFSGLALSILTFLFFCVPETLPEHFKQPIQLSMFNPFQAHLHSLSLLGRDRVLVLLAVISFIFTGSFVGFIVTLFSYLCMIGFSMEEALLPGTVGNAATALFALILVPQLPRLGVWRANLLGHSCWIMAYMLWGPISIACGKAFPYIAGCVQSLAFLLTVPSLQTMVSQRVSASDQAKCQGAIGAVNVLGVFVGIAFYSSILFDATAQGFERSRPALVSGALSAVCLALTAVARKWDSIDHTVIPTWEDYE